jgi:hypothetical protein
MVDINLTTTDTLLPILFRVAWQKKNFCVKIDLPNRYFFAAYNAHFNFHAPNNPLDIKPSASSGPKAAFFQHYH